MTLWSASTLPSVSVELAAQQLATFVVPRDQRAVLSLAKGKCESSFNSVPIPAGFARTHDIWKLEYRWEDMLEGEGIHSRKETDP